MAANHFLSVASLGATVLNGLCDDCAAIAQGAWSTKTPLAGKFVGTYFLKPSTATRTAFTVGAMRLGGQVVVFGPEDIDTSTAHGVRESVRVLSRQIHILVVRSDVALAELVSGARQGNMSVINASMEGEHPTQVIADLATLKEHFGQLGGLHLMHVGPSNPTACAQMLAVAQIAGMKMTMLSPPGYGIPQKILTQAQALATANGATIVELHDVTKLPQGVDVVYTTRWSPPSTPDASWSVRMDPFAVTGSMLTAVAKPGATALFLHDLPDTADRQVTPDALGAAGNLEARLAFHRVTSAMAVLARSVPI